MKKLLSLLLLVAAFGFCLPATLTVTGCATSANVESGGVYAGDATLLNADRVITGTYDVFETFVKWEYVNRLALSANPAIKQSADKIRVNGKQWLESAINLREAYKANPTADGKSKLLAGLAILQAALNEIATYYVANLTPPVVDAPAHP